MMAEDDGYVAHPLCISVGPLERLCALLLLLMGRLTALNLLIPIAPQLPPFHELKHLELHSSEAPSQSAAIASLPRNSCSISDT